MLGPARKAVETNMFCMACKQPGMLWQNLFRNDKHFNELEVCTRFLQATPIRGFCGNRDEVNASLLESVLCLRVSHVHLHIQNCISRHAADLVGVSQAISELDKDAPYVRQSSGGIKAMALEELLPHVIGQMLQ